MKTIIYSIIALVLSIIGVQAQKVQKTVTQSKIEWVGKKIVGSHSGTIDLQKGTLVLKNGQVKGGKFVIDMKSINVTDISGDSKKGLEGHLKNEDFFDVEKYPTSTLEFKKITNLGDGKYKVTANLTLKGITKSITFQLNAKNNKASAELEIDRTQFGIKYKSGTFVEGLGDKAIKDNFDISISFNY